MEKCSVCLDELDGEITIVDELLLSAPGESVMMGDKVCSECIKWHVCECCGLIERETLAPPSYRFGCERCGKHISMECVSVCWSQSYDAICKVCILNEPEGEWICEVCMIDIRHQLYRDAICADSQKMLCYEHTQI
jgi:hypothetical protein